MPSYIAFLRAVNVGKRQVKMASLREWLVEEGFTDVETHIQTGNLKVTTSMRSAAKVEKRLEEILLERCGFEVPCIVFTPAELTQVYADAAALAPPKGVKAADGKRFVVFYKQPPGKAHLDQVAAFTAPREGVWVVGRAAHVWIPGPMMDGVVFGSLAKVFEPGTNRNFNVLTTLAEKWGA